MKKTNFLLLPLLTLPICNCSNSGYVDIVSKITTDDVKDPTLVDDLGQNNSHNEEFFSEIEENDDVNNIFLSI